MKKLIFTIIGFIVGLMAGIYAMLKFLASCPKELNDLKKQFIDKIEFLLLGYNTVKKRNICYSNYKYDPQMEQCYVRGQRHAYNRYGNRSGNYYCGSLDHLKKKLEDALANREEEKDEQN